MRLDVYLTQNGFCESRNRASEIIKNGNVFVNGKCINKPSFDVDETKENEINVKESENTKYVGRGGLKLEGAINGFKLNVSDCVCADVGSSTGGFTQCLLMNGAKRVYAIDSGKDQLHISLRNDNRVVVMEECNARYLTEEKLGERCDLVTMDVSFISQTLLYEAVSNIIKDGGLFVSLIKPQFEAGRDGIGKKGIVKDEKTRQKVCEQIKVKAKEYGFENLGIIDSPIYGGDGNKEHLALFKYTEKN